MSEVLVVPPGAIPDGRGGYSVVTQEQAENWARLQAARAANTAALEAAGWLDPSRREAERQRREREAEAELAAKGDLRERLREAHAVRAAARGEVERLTAAERRAAGHRAAMAAERDRLAEAEGEAARAAATALARALAVGAELPPALATAGAGELPRAERDLDLATAALEQVAGELAAARQQIEAAERAVRLAVHDVLSERAISVAHDLIGRDLELLQARRDLQVLSQAVAGEAWRRFGNGAVPEIVGRALTPVDRTLHPARLAASPDWAAAAAALVLDPEAELPE